MRILVVEDDCQLAEMLAESLEQDDHQVDIIFDGEKAWDMIEGQAYDLLILDLTLPKLDGISLCQRVRSHQMRLPILMLTARDTLADKVVGLDAGADDYMVKPFEMIELRARIRALLRRNPLTMAPDSVWGDLHLNSSTHEARYQSQSLSLTPKEFDLLALLMANGRRVLSRAAIIEHLWPLEVSPTEETIKSHIKGLRHKLNEVGAPEDLIETVYGVGYRLKPN